MPDDPGEDDVDSTPQPQIRSAFHRLHPPQPPRPVPVRPANKSPWESRRGCASEPISVSLFLKRLHEMLRRETGTETCIAFIKAYVDEHVTFTLDSLARASMELDMDERLQQLEALGARAGVRPALDTALSDYKRVFATLLRQHEHGE